MAKNTQTSTFKVDVVMGCSIATVSIFLILCIVMVFDKHFNS